MTSLRLALAVAMASIGLASTGIAGTPARAADSTPDDGAGIERPALQCDPIYEPRSRRLAATTLGPDGRDCRKSGLYHLIVSHPADCSLDAGGARLMRFGYLDDTGSFRPAFRGCFRRFDEAHARAAGKAADQTVESRQPFWIE